MLDLLVLVLTTGWREVSVRRRYVSYGCRERALNNIHCECVKKEQWLYRCAPRSSRFSFFALNFSIF